LWAQPLRCFQLRIHNSLRHIRRDPLMSEIPLQNPCASIIM